MYQAKDFVKILGYWALSHTGCHNGCLWPNHLGNSNETSFAASDLVQLLPLHVVLLDVNLLWSDFYNQDRCTFYIIQSTLSSPRAKRAGPKGLRAESARAFTGRRNSHSGRGEDLTASASMQQGHRKCDLYLDYEHISRLWKGGGGRQELGWSSTCR